MLVVTRFAPSPTGYLHIGGARTALFNWLFAKHHGGQFLLRIEDTDRARSTDQAITAIIEGLKWFGLTWDGDVIYQSQRFQRHYEIAMHLLKQGHAYYCYCTPDELQQMREEALRQGLPFRYNGMWRDRDPSDAPKNVNPVIRLKAQQTGQTILHDQVQGDVTQNNNQLDDMVLVRGDGTPTYMLSVVVDDHDMNITHVIRGDDHLTNSFRQIQIYQAMGWTLPTFAHIPLIHGSDGHKLSKRHGALGIEAYRDMGYLPIALRNYLLRLGWAHGNDEIISMNQAIQWFDLSSCGKSPSRFDFIKLQNLNAHYLKEMTNQDLYTIAVEFVVKRIGRQLTDQEKSFFLKGLEGLKSRAKTIVELVDNSLFYFDGMFPTLDQKALALVTSDTKKWLLDLKEKLSLLQNWNTQSIENEIRVYITENNLKLGDIAQPMRVALTGKTVSPGVFEICDVLGQKETLKRLSLFNLIEI
ncbi:MAG: glutamate--tRNA ligase [Alphaproteobacteria bacterium]|nr:glutamate--tRNA ligase [Alphaproteobacteria bacterium]